MSTNGFTKIRNGIEEHQRLGKVSPFESGLFQIILRQADFETGVWIGSAKRLHESCPRNNNETKSREALRYFTRHLKWLKGFPQGVGRPTSIYLIDKFEATAGRNLGKRVNASKTTDWKNPVFEEQSQGADKTLVENAQAQSIGEKPAALKTNTKIQDVNELKEEREKASPSPLNLNPVGSQETLSLCKYLQSCLGLKFYPDSWLEPAESLLSESASKELRAVIDFASHDPFWTTRVTGMETLCKFLNSKKERGLMSAFLAAERAKEAKRKTVEPKRKPEKNGGRSKW